MILKMVKILDLCTTLPKFAYGCWFVFPYINQHIFIDIPSVMPDMNTRVNEESFR